MSEETIIETKVGNIIVDEMKIVSRNAFKCVEIKLIFEDKTALVTEEAIIDNKNEHYIMLSNESSLHRFLLQKLNKKKGSVYLKLSEENYNFLIEKIQSLHQERKRKLNRIVEEIRLGSRLIDAKIVGCDFLEYYCNVEGFDYEDSEYIIDSAIQILTEDRLKIFSENRIYSSKSIPFFAINAKYDKEIQKCHSLNDDKVTSFSFKLNDALRERIEIIQEKRRSEENEELAAIEKAKESKKDVIIKLEYSYDGDSSAHAKKKFGEECGIVNVFRVATPDGKIEEKEVASY